MLLVEILYCWFKLLLEVGCCGFWMFVRVVAEFLKLCCFATIVGNFLLYTCSQVGLMCQSRCSIVQTVGNYGLTTNSTKLSTLIVFLLAYSLLSIHYYLVSLVIRTSVIIIMISVFGVVVVSFVVTKGTELSFVDLMIAETIISCVSSCHPS